jgi:hypothetical protein
MLSDDKLRSHAILKEVEDSESSANDRFKNLQAGLEDIRVSLASEELRSRALQDQVMRTELEGKLNIPQSRSDLQLDSPDYLLESSGNWIFSHPDYNLWETNSTPEGSVLFLNGSPGSGKYIGFHSTFPQLTDTSSNRKIDFGKDYHSPTKGEASFRLAGVLFLQTRRRW